MNRYQFHRIMGRLAVGAVVALGCAVGLLFLGAAVQVLLSGGGLP